MPLSMREILENTPCFSSRAAYFSGRGAILSDLNYKILTHIHGKIRESHGDAAAGNFVQMVASMDNCNATDFINNCYSLEGNGFKWTIAKTKKTGFDVDKDEDGNHNLAQGMMTAMHMFMGDSNRDETPAIRNRFLRENGVKIMEKYGDHHRGWYDYQ